MKYLITLFVMVLLSSLSVVHGQAVYQHVSGDRIYDFLDELAAEGVLTLNSAVKPYSRTAIYQGLCHADSLKDKLNFRQRKELAWYADYYAFGNLPNHLPTKKAGNLFARSTHSATSIPHAGFFYSDPRFSCSIRPILGFEYFINESGSYKHTYGGLEAFASVGKYVALYADLRDNTVSEILVQPSYFSQDMGGVYKGSVQEGSSDYSEMRGGILLQWDFLQVGVVKDHLVWGDNAHGAIIQSGHGPSFPMLKLHIAPVKWFDFNYFHAWLVSDVVDSALSYLLPTGDHRQMFKNKYMAANLFTIAPVRGLNLSFGNSIIYSDQNVNPAYLIPVFFYKSVDHTQTSNKIVNQNSQMFVNLSARLIRHTHFYLSAYWDDFSVKRISDPDVHNFYALKIGGRLSNWPLRNLSITGEYYRSTPITYKHYGPTLTYESNSYNLGHWLRDNSEEVFFALACKPLPRFMFRYAFTRARHGNEFEYLDGNVAVTYPILKEDTWTLRSHSLLCSWEAFTNCRLSVEYLNSHTLAFDADGVSATDYLNRFTPTYFQGKKSTVMFRINVGF